MNNDLRPINTLPNFKRFCMTIGELPTSYLETMTYYEMLVWFTEYMKNTIIPTINNNGLAIQELQEKYIELKSYVDNYFDNLDVQQEINNKLDAMAESGQLTDIIAQYLGLAGMLVFNNVNDMKQATNLVNGSIVKTLGFYDIGDNGGSHYKIRTIINTDVIDESTIIALNDVTLVAELIYNNEVYVEQFGAKGDGLTDDTDKINIALSYANIIKFVKNKTYMVRGYEEGQATGGTTGLVQTTGLIIPSDKIIDLNFATIKVIPNGRTNYNIFTIKEVNNVILRNGKIVGDRKTHTGSTGEWGYGVSIRYSTNITLENLTCSECWGDGININNNGDITTLCKNIYINNCICDGNRRQGMSIENGENIYVNDSQFINTGSDNINTAPSAGADVEPLTNQFVKNVVFNNCIFANNYGGGIVGVGKIINETDCSIQDLKIYNCKILNNKGNNGDACFSILRVSGIDIKDCIFDNNDKVGVIIRPVGDFIFQNNNLKNARLVSYLGYMSKNIGRIINNTIYLKTDFPYNGVIETPDNPSDQILSNAGNNTIEIINNYIEANSDNDVRYLILTSNSAKVSKLICKNNILKYGKYGIGIKSSCVIDGNDFIAQKGPAMMVTKGTDFDVHDIRNNIFEETSYLQNFAGVIYDQEFGVNNILQNNTLYKNCLNSGDQLTKSYSCVRFLQNVNQTGITLDANNNIFDNTISGNNA